MDRSHGTVALLRVPPRFRGVLFRKSDIERRLAVDADRAGNGNFTSCRAALPKNGARIRLI